MSRTLTERQAKFMSTLFDEADGDVVQAKKLAGYSETTSTSEIVKGLKEEIIDETQTFMARNAPKAAMAVVSGVVNPTDLGTREKLNAAKELLDRTGIVKTEKVQVETSGGIMLLPAKKEESDA